MNVPRDEGIDAYFNVLSFTISLCTTNTITSWPCMWQYILLNCSRWAINMI